MSHGTRSSPTAPLAAVVTAIAATVLRVTTVVAVPMVATAAVAEIASHDANRVVAPTAPQHLPWGDSATVPLQFRSTMRSMRSSLAISAISVPVARPVATPATVADAIALVMETAHVAVTGDRSSDHNI